MNESIKFSRVLYNLSLIKRQQKLYPEAEQLFLKAVDIQSSLLGSEHPDLAAMYKNLGLTALDQGDFNLVIKNFHLAHQIQFNSYGLAQVNIAFSISNLGHMYIYLRQLETAEQWINQTLDLRLSMLGAEHLLCAATLMIQTEWARLSNNPTLAIKSLDAALNIRSPQLKEGDRRLTYTSFDVASIRWLRYSNQSKAM